MKKTTCSFTSDFKDKLYVSLCKPFDDIQGMYYQQSLVSNLHLPLHTLRIFEISASHEYGTGTSSFVLRSKW